MSWPRFHTFPTSQIFTLGFPTGKRLRQCRRSARAVKPREASMTISTHQGLAGKLLVEKGAESKQCLLSAPRRATNSLYSTDEYWWPLLVVSWSSSGHQAVTVTYDQVVSIGSSWKIFFTLPAMFFFPGRLLSLLMIDLLQWVSTCLNCFSHLLRSRKGRWTHTTATLQQFVKLQCQGRADSAWRKSASIISWSGPWYQNLAFHGTIMDDLMVVYQQEWMT